MRVGVTPKVSEPITLREDGVVMRGDEPFYDYETGEPVKCDSRDVGVVLETLKAANALSSRDRVFGLDVEVVPLYGKGDDMTQQNKEQAATKKRGRKPRAESTKNDEVQPVQKKKRGRKPRTVAPLDAGALVDAKQIVVQDVLDAAKTFATSLKVEDLIALELRIKVARTVLSAG